LSWWQQMTDSLAATKRLRLVAIGLMIAAVNCFSVLDASAKYLSLRQVAERVELKSNLLRVDQEEDRAQLAAAHSLDEEAISKTCATGLCCCFVFDIQIGSRWVAPLCFSARESKPPVT